MVESAHPYEAKAGGFEAVTSYIFLHLPGMTYTSFLVGLDALLSLALHWHCPALCVSDELRSVCLLVATVNVEIS